MTDIQEAPDKQDEAAGSSETTEGNPSEKQDVAADALGDAGKQAIDRMKTERNSARNELKTVNAELAKYRKAEQDRADADKSEAEKRAASDARAEAAELRATRLEVAHAKGLTPAQAKRLVGSTQAEIEADADEILRDFPTAPAKPAAPKPDPSQGARGETKTRPTSLGAAVAEHYKKP